MLVPITDRWKSDGELCVELVVGDNNTDFFSATGHHYHLVVVGVSFGTLFHALRLDHAWHSPEQAGLHVLGARFRHIWHVWGVTMQNKSEDRGDCDGLVTIILLIYM